MTPTVAIILVNWNGLQDTLACLDSLSQINYPTAEIIVVDNGSQDNSVDQIRHQYPHIILIETGENLGFVGGNNVGMEHPIATKADYILLLNNDTEVSPNFLDILIDTAQSDPQIGIVGPTIYYFDEPKTVWSAGGAIDWQYGTTRMLNLNELDSGQFDGPSQPVDFVTGCALLIKQHVITKIGKLDPDFFAYYEETEWCVRATQAGYKILYVPQSKIWHKISIVAREASPQVHYYMTRNRLLFLKRTQAGLKAWGNTLFLDYLKTIISWTVKPKWRHKKPQRQAMLQAIIDYSRGRLGRVDIA